MSGKLVCDDYSGYKALFKRGVIEAGCLAHARRTPRLVCQPPQRNRRRGLRYFAALYEIEREAREQKPRYDAGDQLRMQRSKPIAEALRQWLTRQRGQVPDGSPLRRPSTTVLGAGRRSRATSRMVICQRTTIISRIESAQSHSEIELDVRRIASRWAARRRHHELDPNGQAEWHDPYRYLKDVLDRLPTHPASRIDELLPHRWRPTPSALSL